MIGYPKGRLQQIRNQMRGQAEPHPTREMEMGALFHSILRNRTLNPSKMIG